MISVKHNNFVKQRYITIELVLDDVVENFQEEENQVVIRWSRKQEPGGAECLQKVQQLGACNHGQCLQVRRNCRQKYFNNY